MPMGWCRYIFRSIDAVLVYHHSGFSGCLCAVVLVLTIGAHGGGCTASMLSFMYFVSCVMNVCAGMLCGVGMFLVGAPWSSLCCFCYFMASYKSSLG